MGGLQVHNHATLWPNLQEGTCKNSIWIEFQVGFECGNIFHIPLWLSSDLTLETEFKLDMSVTKKYIGSKYHLVRLKFFLSKNTYSNKAQSAVLFTHSHFLGTAIAHGPISHFFCTSIIPFASHIQLVERFREYRINPGTF